jgi:beta-glucosidase
VTPRRLPAGFLLGCATAAHQVEGGVENDWSRFERRRPSPIADGSDASAAIDHYRRYRDDLEQLAADHHNAHRFSVEWARVEPQPGCFDSEALRHYRDVVRTCRHLGVEPVVTLHHFTLPGWLADRGGLLDPEMPRFFARYAAACAETLGDGVAWWLTINEPAVLAVQGFLNGMWPPQRRSLPAAFAALRGLLRMHAAGARAVREVALRHGWSARISVAHHERRLRPRPGASPLDRAAAVLPDFVFNRWFLRSCMSGRMLPPVGAGERVPGARGSLDYLGVNYYSEDTVTFDVRAPLTLFARVAPDPAQPISSFGWAIFPDGLRRALDDLWRETRLPMLITENGVADEHDELRPRYITDHLGAVLDAIDAGVDVRGYLHWTAWDNFEWAEGYTKRFGLYAVDRSTMLRTAKASAALYAEICRTRTVPG